MYMKKNKAHSFLEIVVSLAVFLFISTAIIFTFFSLNKNFKFMYIMHQKEKKLISFKDLIISHLKWNSSSEIRILNIKNENNFPSFFNIFQNPGDKEGNLLIIKFKKYRRLEREIEISYRCFLSIEKKLKISYVDYNSSSVLGGTVKFETISENHTAKFYKDENTLKIIIEDNKKGKLYEEILHY